MDDEPEYLSTKQVARKLGITIRSVRRLIKSGYLPAFEICGSWRLRIPRGAAEALLVEVHRNR